MPKMYTKSIYANTVKNPPNRVPLEPPFLSKFNYTGYLNASLDRINLLKPISLFYFEFNFYNI